MFTITIVNFFFFFAISTCGNKSIVRTIVSIVLGNSKFLVKLGKGCHVGQILINQIVAQGRSCSLLLKQTMLFCIKVLRFFAFHQCNTLWAEI